MKTLTPLFCALSLILTQTAINAEGLYKWKDSKGNTQYGDRPPANINAEAFDLPKITVIENYADQWKPMKFGQSGSTQQQTIPEEKTEKGIYSKLAFLAPKANQSIRANDGDVSAMVSIKPPLKKGHKIIFSIDGKAMAKGTSRTKNFSSLNRGSHTAAVKIVDANGRTVKSSSVKFNVLRVNALNKNASNQASALPKLKTFNNVRQQQIQNSN